MTSLLMTSQIRFKVLKRAGKTSMDIFLNCTSSTHIGESICNISEIIIHHTHYEKSDWSRAFNQFTIACELDMINAISAADIAFIMSSSTSAWLLSPLECSQKQNG